MGVQKFKIKHGSGKYTPLDRAYNNFITSKISVDELEFDKWVTYNQIVCEINDINDGVMFEEMKYRLTGGEEPSEVLSEMISRVEYPTPLLLTLRNFLDVIIIEEFLKRWL